MSMNRVFTAGMKIDAQKQNVPDINVGEIRKAELIIEVMEWVDMAGLIIEPIIFIRYNHARFKSLPSMTYYVKAETYSQRETERIGNMKDLFERSNWNIFIIVLAIKIVLYDIPKLVYILVR